MREILRVCGAAWALVLASAAAPSAHAAPGTAAVAAPPAPEAGAAAAALPPSPVTPPPVTLPATPAQNLTKGARPALTSAEAAMRRVLAAIVADDPASVAGDFFPAAVFDVLKGIPRPREYWTKLNGWYAADIHREHARVKDLGPLTFDGYKATGCQWKPVGSEANKIAYWSCYRSHFYARAAAATPPRVVFELRAMINWGETWYVTHLGAMPAAKR